MIIIRNRQDFISAAASSIDDMTNDECKRERRVGKLNENYYQDSADSKVSSGDI
jgi:hypothetical protein